MSKELVLKSETKTPSNEIVQVRTLQDVQFYGVNGKQLSASMQGLHMRWDGSVVRVTHDSFPGQEKWLFPAGIEHITFKSDS